MELVLQVGDRSERGGRLVLDQHQPAIVAVAQGPKRRRRGKVLPADHRIDKVRQRGRRVARNGGCRIKTRGDLIRLRTDLFDLLEAVVDDRLSEFPPERLEWDRRPAVCVVMASEGYPGPYAKGFPITGLAEVATMPDVMVFHAGTKGGGDVILTDGGRVLGVTALGDTLADAQKRAYEAVSRIHFRGAFYRRDIAAKALPSTT